MKVEDKVLDLAKRRGFVWGPSPNIYTGGLSGFYDWGPLGKLLKNKVENVIRKGFSAFEFWEVECPTIMPKEVWQASGHLTNFVDYITKCKKCNSSYRVDHLIDGLEEKDPEKIKKIITHKNIKCPSCKGELGNVVPTNLMMKTVVGLDQEVFLRPETATTTYLLFPELYRFFRTKIPFGVFQIGKAYRNEISPRQGVFRTREFTQAEAQLFIMKEQETQFSQFKEHSQKLLPLLKYGSEKIEKVKLGETIKKNFMKKEAYSFMVYVAYQLVENMGFDKSKIRIRQHNPAELAFYADDAWDIEVLTERYGWFEICGIHDRTDYDLKQHATFSKTRMDVQNQSPNILEIAFGLERTTYVLLENSLIEDKERDWIHFQQGMAPIDVAIFPLMSKDGLDKLAKDIFNDLKSHLTCEFDDAGNIGKMYRRQDEIGTPWCVTVDYKSIEDKTVTIRDRDSLKQERVEIDELREWFLQKLAK